MKNMDDQSFEKKIRSELHDFRETPDPGTWEKLSERLDQPRRRRRSAVTWSLAAAGILIVGIWIGGELLTDNARETEASAVRGGSSARDLDTLQDNQQSGAGIVEKQGQLTDIEDGENDSVMEEDTATGDEHLSSATHRNAERQRAPKRIPPNARTNNNTALLPSGEDRGDENDQLHTLTRKDPSIAVEGTDADTLRNKANALERNEMIDILTDASAIEPAVATDSLTPNEVVGEHKDLAAGLQPVKAEEDERKQRHRSSFSISLLAGPSLMFNDFQGTGSDMRYVNDLRDPSGLSRDRLGYRTGFMGDWRILSRWKVSLGGVYHQRNYEGTFSSIRFTAGEMEIIGGGDETLITPKESTVDWTYRESSREIAVTLNVAYLLGQRAGSYHYLGTGLNMGRYRIISSADDLVYRGRESRTSFSIFYELERPIAERWILNVQPVFTRGLEGKDRSTLPVHAAMSYDISLLVGIGYRFR